ncbi:FAD-dependent oxidoreductase [Paracoccaceae bacterium]|nr:FAD-dependent oxidoreductase [Paracoccaceae bacterium]
MTDVPKKARAVIIGGGIIGCSVAYHLTKLGWKDVLLLERKQLTSGTTWHAAGLIAQLRATANMTKLAKYSQELYGSLEKETGVATGFKRCGSITVALTNERKEEIYRQASMARAFGVEVEEISPQEVKEKYSYLNIDQVKAGVWLPLDGQGDPANIALALAKGARQNGGIIIQNTKVTGFKKEGRRITGVNWSQGDEMGTTDAELVVNCAGMWGHNLGKMMGVNVPLHACEHFYIVTEPVKDLKQMPVLRVPDECAYYKEDAGKFMLGAFEPNAKPWGMEGISENFEFDQLPEDFDHFEPILEMAVNRIPALGEAGIHTFFNGPESFTPDDAYHLGLAPEMDNVWIAAGFNSIGIQSAGGAGMALAQWITTGKKPFDLGDVDISRMQPFQGNKKYLFERSKETLGLLYADHYPYRQKASARGIRRSPFHSQLLEKGAVMGELAGWERANWYAERDQKREYEYSWKRQNWFENSAQEHRAVRENIGIYDMSSFGKIRVEGSEACEFLNYISGANCDVPIGKIVYTQFLNEDGGIEADVTVTRLSELSFMVVTPAATRLADQTWMLRHSINFNIVIIDVTSAEGVLAIMGPNSRKLLAQISSADLSNKNNPFGTAQEVEIGMGLARIHRVSFVGELGWEVYATSDQAGHIFEVIADAGQEMGLKFCGMHMMDSCRIEKGFRHFGHDITCEDHVLEAGLGFAVQVNKPNFIGRTAVLEKQDAGLNKRLLQFKLNEKEPLLYHNEPIIRDGKISGYISSGNYGHTLGGAIGLGYIECENETVDDLLRSSYEIEVAGSRIKAAASIRPMYDPKAERVRL